MLEGVQGQAAKEILKEVDVVVCSCIGAGNDAFVRAIGGDQERYDRRTAPSIESHTLIRIYLYGVKSCITANYRRDAAATKPRSVRVLSPAGCRSGINPSRAFIVSLDGLMCILYSISLVLPCAVGLARFVSLRFSSTRPPRPQRPQPSCPSSAVASSSSSWVTKTRSVFSFSSRDCHNISFVVRSVRMIYSCLEFWL